MIGLLRFALAVLTSPFKSKLRLEAENAVRLAQDNDVVHALTSDRSDQPFGKAILPG
jgi:hypothetical protein